MSKIQINNESYLEYDGYQYMPYYFQKATGELVRNPKTGEMVPTVDKWVHTGTFHGSIEHAIRKLAEVKVLTKAEYSSLEEYVKEFRDAYSFLRDSLEKH